MKVSSARVDVISPTELELHVRLSGLDPVTAGDITTLANDLARDGADGVITAAESVQIVSDVVAIVSPAFGAKFGMLAPALSGALADGKINRFEALTLGLQMAMAFGA